MVSRRRPVAAATLRARVVAAIMLAAVLAALPIMPAAVEPATVVLYPTSTSATRLTGYAFDTCSAPPLATMQTWKIASPYRGVGTYIGGVSRSCAQPNLTAAWVTVTSLQGWRIIPIYVGHQAPCTSRPNATKFSSSTAAALGTTDAADRTDVLTYVSAWTKELHRLGYLAGMYANLSTGAKHLSEAYISPAYARPDVLWMARWDGIATLTDWAGIPNALWSNHQRGKQYGGDHVETHGGIKINIDSNLLDAPVATVGYAYQITSSANLNGRSGPLTSTAVVQGYPPGATVGVVCQTAGTKIGTTSVWNKLTDGNYVSDYYVSTPSKTS